MFFRAPWPMYVPLAAFRKPSQPLFSMQARVALPVTQASDFEGQPAVDHGDGLPWARSTMRYVEPGHETAMRTVSAPPKLDPTTVLLSLSSPGGRGSTRRASWKPLT